MVTTGSTHTRTRFTTVWGGCGIALAGLLSLVATLAFTVPGESAVSLSWLQLVASVILLVALRVLAFGIRSEQGIVGGSRIGRVGLVLFGAFPLAQGLLALISSTGTDDAARVLGNVSLVLSAAALASGITAALVILRVGVLTGPVRWAFALVVAWNALMTVIDFIPVLLQATFPWGYAIGFLLQIGLGASYALYGQSESLRRGMESLNRRW